MVGWVELQGFNLYNNNRMFEWIRAGAGVIAGVLMVAVATCHNKLFLVSEWVINK